MSDRIWYVATVTKDMRCGDKCSCGFDRSKAFLLGGTTFTKDACKNCGDTGKSSKHLWGYASGNQPFLKAGSKVLVARSEAAIIDHGPEGKTYLPESWWVFERSESGKKMQISTEYAITHLKRVQPIQTDNQLGERALSNLSTHFPLIVISKKEQFLDRVINPLNGLAWKAEALIADQVPEHKRKEVLQQIADGLYEH